MGGGARGALVLAALAVVASGCLGIGRSGSGKYPQYAKYQRRTEARAQIDALLATIPVYPGARVAGREFTATGYYVGKNYEMIDAEPYSLGVYYHVPGGLSGTSIMRFFRRALPARGWQCGFTARAHGVRRSFVCQRGHQAIGGSVNDSGGYGLTVTASDVVPPIKQVPQVE